MIYVFSNIEYDQKHKIRPKSNDLLVFLNKASSINFYKSHKNKIVFHRSTKENYGSEISDVENHYVFRGPKDKTIPKDFIKKVKESYDWNYDVEEGKTKCCTTGYMVVKYLEATYPDEKIILVNFGYKVKKSTYRCPYHNWVFEDNELQKFEHIYTVETNDDTIEIVYCVNDKYLKYLNMSALTVLKHNPNAHITILSDKKLNTVYDNIIVDFSKYHLKYDVKRFTNTTYFRMLIPEYLKNKEKALYLDADTICMGSLKDLWHRDIRYLGATRGHNFVIRVRAKEHNHPYYFLSGVLIMNLTALRKINFSETFMYIAEHFDFPNIRWLCEETIMNHCFYDYITPIKANYNYVYGKNYSMVNEDVTDKNAAIIHFPCGLKKTKMEEYFKKEMGTI